MGALGKIKLNPDRFVHQVVTELQQKVEQGGGRTVTLSLTHVVISVARRVQLPQNVNRHAINGALIDWWLSLPKAGSSYDRVLFGRHVVLTANHGPGFVSIGKDPATGERNMDCIVVLGGVKQNEI